MSGGGSQAPDFLKDLAGLETNRINQLVVQSTLQTTRDENVFAIGDCAACPWVGKEGALVPPRAQSAHQQASHMAKQVKARLAKRPLAEWRYRDFGSLVSLGEYSTVGSLMSGLSSGSMWIEGWFARMIICRWCRCTARAARILEGIAGHGGAGDHPTHRVSRQASLKRVTGEDSLAGMEECVMSTPHDDPAKWLATMLENSQVMMRQFTQPGMTGSPGSENSGVPNPFAAASHQFAQMQQNYVRQMADMWTGMWKLPGTEAAAAPQDNRRFAAEPWSKDPRFDMVKRMYRGYSEFLQNAVNAAPVDDKTKAQLHFATRQFSEAISPANFFATNPEAMQLAAETGGQSIVEGMKLFVEDLAKGRVSMTDESAFEIGKNIATTKGSVVFENELIQLIQYAPRSDQVYSRPLVIIPPAINKYYILDLQPENSFVQYAVDEGQTVFLVSWRNITPDLGHLTWDDYLKLGVMAAIDVAKNITGADRVNTLGFCVGGTLLASALAVMAAQGKDQVSSVTFLTTMLDFSETGEIGLLISDQSLKMREQTIGQGGVLEGKELGFVFSSLRANDLIWQYVVNSYLKGKAPPAFDLLYWNSDGTNLPGPMFCWYVRNTYLENNLREPGKTIMCDTPVDLGKIAAPAYIYASREDHIVPWKTAYASNDLLGGDTTFVLGASGHIAGVINPPKKNKRNYWTGGGRKGDADAWLSSATSVAGSWWPDWSGWLARYGGKRVAARAALGSRKYPVIEPAPGRYVTARSA